MPEGISRVIVQDEHMQLYHVASVDLISAMFQECLCSIVCAPVT